MNWTTRLDRAISLVCYHRPQQFFYRALRTVQRRLPSRSLHRSLDRLGPVRITDDAEGLLQRMAERRLQLWPARHDVEWLQNMSRGEFRFLNQSATWAERHTMPRLWRFHLHSQESLLELAEHIGAEHAWRLVGDWLAEYPSPGRDADAWHPFCISRRLPVWLMLAARHGVPESLQENFWTSVHHQTFWLSRNLEWDLGGNHLLENLRTLFVARAVLKPRAGATETQGGTEGETTTNNTNTTNRTSRENNLSGTALAAGLTSGEPVPEFAESFGGSDQSPKVLATSATGPSPAAPASDPPGGRVMGCGENGIPINNTNRLCDFRHVSRWLQRQIDEQILPTGEHFERAPTYHALMLLSLLEINDVLPLMASSAPVSGTALAAGFASGEGRGARGEGETTTNDTNRTNEENNLSGTALAAGFARHLHETIVQMQQFLGSILHPDGMIPLFGDSVIDETPMPAVLIAPGSALVSGTALAAGLASGERRETSGERETTTNNTNTTNGVSGTGLATGPDAGVKERVRPEASAYGSGGNDYWVDRFSVGHWQTGLSRWPSPPLFAARRGRGEFKVSFRDHSSRFLPELSSSSCLIFDHGPLACDHLPAHGHADLLTFEASWGGRRLIIDRGTFDYEDSPERQLCRGTAGHNTLQVDGIDHADIWSRFRMGRRGRVIDVRRGEDTDASWCLASHNAYARFGVPRVIRLIVAHRPADADDPVWLIVDVADGTGRHAFRSPLHVHPSWDVVKSDRAGSYICHPKADVEQTDQSSNVQIAALAERVDLVEQVRLEASFYAPNFGEKIENVAVARRWTAEGLTWSGWLIGPENAKTMPTVTVSRDVVRVEWSGWVREWLKENHESHE